MEKVKQKDIVELIARINGKLEEQGQNFRIVTYWAYGRYGADKQEIGKSGTSHLIGLGTKKECYNELKAYYWATCEVGEILKEREAKQ